MPRVRLGLVDLAEHDPCRTAARRGSIRARHATAEGSGGADGAALAPKWGSGSKRRDVLGPMDRAWNEAGEDAWTASLAGYPTRPTALTFSSEPEGLSLRRVDDVVEMS